MFDFEENKKTVKGKCFEDFDHRRPEKQCVFADTHNKVITKFHPYISTERRPAGGSIVVPCL